MARGDHPMRTPVYGVLLIVAAMVAGTVVSVWTHPAHWVKVVVLLACLVAWLAGLLMTLRDLTPSRRR